MIPRIMCTGKLLPSLLLVTGFSMMEARARAESPPWVPALGTLTTLQETDIRLVSQELAVNELRQVSLEGGRAWVMDVKARYGLRNTSRAKKKPTILFPVCRTRASLPEVCDLKKAAVKVKVDGRRATTKLVQQGDRVYLRLSVKFGPHWKKEVEVSFRLVENEAGWGRDRPFAQFDYDLGAGAAWQGKAGGTRIRIRVPYKADSFSTRVDSARGRTERKTAFVTWSTGAFDPEPNEVFRFIAITPTFKYQTDKQKQKLNRNPKSAYRRFETARLLAAYYPAVKEIAKHLRVAVGRKFRKWDAAKKRDASNAFAGLITWRHHASSAEVLCDPALCTQRGAIGEIIPGYCRSNDRCVADLGAALDQCCGGAGPPPVESTSRAASPAVAAAGKKAPTDRAAKPPPADTTFEEKASIALISFIGLVWLIAGIAVIVTLKRRRSRLSRAD